MSKDNGGQAFPRMVEQSNGYMQAVEGMTLRDYFAAKAMQGLCSSEGHLDRIGSFASAAGIAYELADAMLAERSKQ